MCTLCDFWARCFSFIQWRSMVDSCDWHFAQVIPKRDDMIDIPLVGGEEKGWKGAKGWMAKKKSDSLLQYILGISV